MTMSGFRCSDVFRQTSFSVKVFPNAVVVISGLISPSKDDLECVKRNLGLIDDRKIISVDGNGNAVNMNGFTLSQTSIGPSPSRYVDLFGESSGLPPEQAFISFILLCEQVHYDALVIYASIYPDVARSIWWRAHGHIATYRQGQHIGFHTDTDVECDWGSQPSSQQQLQNILSINLYLNECSDAPSDSTQYSGGQIAWKYSDVTFSPKAGDVVIYPSNFLGTHCVLPVKSGLRMAYLSVAGCGVDIPAGETKGRVGTGERTLTTHGRTWMPYISNHAKMVSPTLN
jgi:hypothetical protein